MSKVIHPYFTFWNANPDIAIKTLKDYVLQGLLLVRDCGDNLLFCYSKKCVQEARWDDITIMCRGLIVNKETFAPVALPFPKGFNYHELIGRGMKPEDFTGDFETYAKIDGSLGILYYNGPTGWGLATKGSFKSDVAVAAQEMLKDVDLSCLNQDVTYLIEIIHPDNRVVVPYDYTGFVLLGGYNVKTGEEIHVTELHPHVEKLSVFKGYPIIYDFNSIESIREHTQMSGTGVQVEGFIVRFSDGRRVKFKYLDYLEAHRTRWNLTKKHILEQLISGKQYQDIRNNLPEEFFAEFDALRQEIITEAVTLLKRVKAICKPSTFLKRKDLAVFLDNHPDKAVHEIVWTIYDRKPLMIPIYKWLWKHRNDERTT